MLNLIRILFFTSLTFILFSCITFDKTHQVSAVTDKVQRFKDEAEFKKFVLESKVFAKYRETERDKIYEKEYGDKIIVTGSRVKASDLPSITNNQVQGVDEGDIIKRHGDFLFILRNGTIHSIKINNNSQRILQKVDELKIEIENPELRNDTWFDEMLVNDGVLLITGFNYEYDYTVLTRYIISNEGKLSYLNTHVITSNDYFSGTNYGSRLYHGKLISYIPFELRLDREYLSSFPKIALVKPKQNISKDKLYWENLIDVSNIVKPSNQLEFPIVHLFIKCSINDTLINCQSSGVIGTDFPQYYISGEFAYLWVSGWKGDILSDAEFDLESTLVAPNSNLTYLTRNYKGKYLRGLEQYADSKLYRISLNDFTVEYFPTKLVPFDHFSFHEHGDDFYMFGLNSKNSGQLIKIESRMFKGVYSPQSKLIAEASHLGERTNNRFLSESFIYGDMSHFGDIDSTQSKIIDLETGKITALELSHSADRFESLGGKALVVGETQNNNLGLTVIPEERPLSFKQLFLEDRLEGEARSHAFNATRLNDYTVFGLTTQLKSKAKDHHNYYMWDDDVPSDLTFFNYQDILNTSGTLISKETNYSDDCDVSCEDWYGNTRPFFIEDRIFGLSGDELIEARLQGTQIIEERRINITR